MNHLVKDQIKAFFPKFYSACAYLLKAGVATSVNSSTDRNDVTEAAGQVGVFFFNYQHSSFWKSW